MIVQTVYIGIKTHNKIYNTCINVSIWKENLTYLFSGYFESPWIENDGVNDF